MWVKTQWHSLVNLDQCMGLSYWYDSITRKWTVRAYTGEGEDDYWAICETDTEEAAQKVIDDIGSGLSKGVRLWVHPYEVYLFGEGEDWFDEDEVALTKSEEGELQDILNPLRTMPRYALNEVIDYLEQLDRDKERYDGITVAQVLGKLINHWRADK